VRRFVDVWLIDLERDAERLLARTDLLARAEWTRGERFARPADRAAFLASHVGLRLVLGAYGGRAGDFQRDEFGKPRLPGAPAFSLSRTRGVALVAVADRPVGVDIEARRPLAIREPAVDWIATRRRTTPLEAWTALEALAKWQGSGVARLLQMFDADPARWSALWARACPQLSAIAVDRAPGFYATLCGDGDQPPGGVSLRSLEPLALEPFMF
jgi:4'-phosphopantetheinyl transferase